MNPHHCYIPRSSLPAVFYLVTLKSGNADLSWFRLVGFSSNAPSIITVETDADTMFQHWGACNFTLTVCMISCHVVVRIGEHATEDS